MAAVLVTLLTLPSISYAYSWTFRANPQQCANLTIDISGSDGKPPYRVLITPTGPSPLAGNVEARHILDVPFSDGANSVTFQLKYPENSQFVAVVSSFSSLAYIELLVCSNCWDVLNIPCSALREAFLVCTCPYHALFIFGWQGSALQLAVPKDQQ